ncbi:lipoyl(octanoyl) transferase LipB [Nakamurella silvestris]|nr:lipoyl(octanoyl) transferase LipB [Nakamurella silvestris]
MRVSNQPLRIVDAGVVDYVTARQWQLDAATARIADTGPDTVYLLQHPSVYTAGKRTQPEDLPNDGSPVIEADRGGRITWHGPGQLVVYPIIKLAEAFDVVGYVRLLEQALILLCDDLGLRAGRIAGRSGVWVPADEKRPDRKLGAIGVRVAKGVTSHGIGLNCNPDMSAFDRIVPCGISDAGVSSLSLELGREVTVEEVLPLMAARLTEAFDGRIQVLQDTLYPADPTPTSIPSASPVSASGLRLELDPVLQGS